MKDKLQKVRSFLMVAVSLIALTFANSASAAYDIVTESSGTISFAPGVLVTAIITGVIAAVASAAALVVISLGVRWLFRMLKGAK